MSNDRDERGAGDGVRWGEALPSPAGEQHQQDAVTTGADKKTAEEREMQRSTRPSLGAGWKTARQAEE
jgi:hypothetical protein